MRKLSVKVKPNSRQQTIEVGDDGGWTICLQSPPVEGKAQAEWIKLLAKIYGVRKSQVQIESEVTAKIKQIEID